MATKVKVKEAPPPIPVAEMQRRIRSADPPGKPGKVWRWWENPDGSLEVAYTEPPKQGERVAASATLYPDGFTIVHDGW